MKTAILDDAAVNILGELLWHAATIDDSIKSVSEEHMRDVLAYADRFISPARRKAGLRFLEVAAYAHITGYMLSEKFGWKATVSDISVETLALGASNARAAGMAVDSVRKVAVDFHDLPFEDGAFDIVYICSALHHTLQWETVLRELARVTSSEGVLILQNEPCQRDFCFYKFPTNRNHDFRPIEILLEQQGILKTVAEPYPGSRPESLFGMIENQKMPIDAILGTLKQSGSIVELTIDSQACLSDFDRQLLSSGRDAGSLALQIESGLVERIREATGLLDDTDIALGIKLPQFDEIKDMSSAIAKRICELPAIGSEKYKLALASIFGAALTIVLRKDKLESANALCDVISYDGGTKKGVKIGYPARLSAVLDLAYDLVPDIQVAETEEIYRHFSEADWLLHGTPDVRYLILRGFSGSIVLRQHQEDGIFVVLLRAYANPIGSPFRLQLLANGSEIAAVDVHQKDSFLLRGQLPNLDVAPTLVVRACALDGGELQKPMPVTVPAVRIVCVALPSD